MVNQNLSGFEEIIKCVVVGDSGVGKTCLICAYACNTKYSLSKLVKTHQATVWAIDHYQHDQEILDRSWCDVDGCRVSLRLWDTFGYHDKDRGFAFRGADVIILCFSVARPATLHNVRRIWNLEIQRSAPSTPVILCGTQADLRYLCYDDEYISMEKGLLYRNISPKDIITPSVGREVARDIGAPYYESSVLTHFGIADVFINASRAALVERRKIKFWNTQLRKVQRPMVQPPMKMPVPSLKSIEIAPAVLNSDICSLIKNRSECDVTFIVQNHNIEAHRICLAVASKFFHDLFSHESLSKLPAKRPKNVHLRKKFPQRFSHTDREGLLDSDQESLSTDTDCESSVPDSGGDDYLSPGMLKTSSRFPLTIPYDHKAVASIEVRYEDDGYGHTHKILKLFISLNAEITAMSFRTTLEYLYSGNLHNDSADFTQLRKTAELLQLSDLTALIDNITSHQEFFNFELGKKFHETRIHNLKQLALENDFLSDITFQVDNGFVSAHKALLMARCEMMFAMFSDDFIESASDVIPFPGITCETFRALQEYLYTGESPSMCGVDCIALIEVANRLCLTRLVNMVEKSVVAELQTYDNKDELLKDVITLLEPAEFYNAYQLARFCMYTLSINYRDIIQKHQKLFRTLSQEKQDEIEPKQWPPIWYLEEVDQYEKQWQFYSHHANQAAFQDYQRKCGCLCFSRKGRHRLAEPVELPT